MSRIGTGGAVPHVPIRGETDRCGGGRNGYPPGPPLRKIPSVRCRAAAECVPPPMAVPLASPVLEEVRTMVKELNSLDVSLHQLFSNPPNTHRAGLDLTYASGHEALVLYRGRLARRVTRYSAVVKSMAQKMDQGSSEEKQFVELLHADHVKSLQAHKSRLSGWWSETERHFHMLRMASYVSEMELSRQTSVTSTDDPGSDVSNNTPPLQQFKTPNSPNAGMAQRGGRRVVNRALDPTKQKKGGAGQESGPLYYQASNNSTLPGSRASSVESAKDLKAGF